MPYIVINARLTDPVEAYLYSDCEVCKDEPAGERRLMIVERTSMFLATYQSDRLLSGAIGAKAFEGYGAALAHYRDEQAYWRERAKARA